MLEYACEVWSPGLTLGLSQDIERVQIRALKIIRPDLDYWEALDTFKLMSLEERCITQCKKLYGKLKNPEHSLHYLLPPLRTIVHDTRHTKERLPD